MPKRNLAPGMAMPVVRRGEPGDGEEGGMLHTMTWGLVPRTTKATEKPDFWRAFNCRSETAREKPMFKRLRRCVALIDGFYEWKGRDAAEAHGPAPPPKKQPHLVHRENAVMFVAGLYDAWTPASADEPLYTVTLLTTEPDEGLRWLHDRQPVILDAAGAKRWLGLAGDDVDWAELTRGRLLAGVKWHAVDPAIGKLSHNAEGCDAQWSPPRQGRDIRSFFGTPKPKREADGGGGGGGGGVAAKRART